MVKGPNVMAGYLHNPDATAETIRDGWLHTGDVGYIDPDGYFFIVDRAKDMIIRGGENIYPREIEEVLYTHPGILGCAVIGVPDEVRGEEVVAVLAPETRRRTRRRELKAWAGRAARGVQGARGDSRSAPSCRRPRPARSANLRCAKNSATGRPRAHSDHAG